MAAEDAAASGSVSFTAAGDPVAGAAPGDPVVVTPPRHDATAERWLVSTSHPPRILPPGTGTPNDPLRLPWARNTQLRIEPAAAELLPDAGTTPLPFGLSPESEFDARVRRVGPEIMSTRVLAHGGDATAASAEPIPLQPDTDYLFRARYQVRGFEFGASASLDIEVQNGDAPSDFHTPEHFMQVQHTGSGGWAYTPVRFTTGPNAEAAVVRLGAAGAPIDLRWKELSLREAPEPLAQLPADLGPADEPPVMSEAQVREMLAAEEPAAVAIERRGGQPVILIDGEPAGALFYNPNFYFWDAGYPQLGARLAREAGMRLQQITLSLGDAKDTGGRDGVGVPVWRGDGDIDFAELDRRILVQLRHSPDALLRLNIGADTYYDFDHDHPDAVYTSPDGDRVVGWSHSGKGVADKADDEVFAFSYAAAAYREACGEVLRRLGEHLAGSDLGKRVIGIHLAIGADGQSLPTLDAQDERDRSPGHLAAFRDWLGREYGDDAGLQEAWGDPDASLATADQLGRSDIQPPTPANWFLDPADGRHRRIIDSNRFQSERKAETAIHLAAAFDAGFGRESITTTYWSDVTHAHNLDHWATRTLLDSPHIDGLVSIGDYGFWRDPGFTGAISSAAGSFRLRDKLFIAEADHRTPLSWLSPDAVDSREYVSAFKDPEDPPHQVRREWGQALALGGGAWYYALSGTAWSDPLYVDFMAEAQRVAQRIAEDPAVDADRPAVATFADERSIDHMTQERYFGLYHFQHSHNFPRIPLAMSGLGYDPYLLPDVAHADLPEYPLLVFLSANTIDEAQVAAVEELQRGGRVVVVVNAAGVSGPLGLTETVRRMTGLTVELEPGTETWHRYAATGSDPLAEHVDRINTPTRGPMIHLPEDALAEAGGVALARYEDGRVAAAVRRHADWTGVYLAAPGGLSPRLLRNLAAEAGVTPVGPENDATYAGNRMVVVHSMNDQPKTLRWDEPADLVDLTTDAVVAEDATDFTFDLPVGETRWFRRVAGR
ncbi:hypothetical protein PSMK_09110 [Phycisphaera mikurensis NBRC 102666]|uniref:Glycoside hydrolase family 42 N-terminal domain-containing protein n=1 Tax=Phycisphaera mikurensis (strain NBRC 102666 / KCTC 22515 / FYK2301M01) TaxID=1142394 RepID=I0ICT2_PHYMF|nr:hypothetical protein PSMK_09110 [Phycisphaera mikurensis NBRC 102666]